MGSEESKERCCTWERWSDGGHDVSKYRTMCGLLCLRCVGSVAWFLQCGEGVWAFLSKETVKGYMQHKH